MDQRTLQRISCAKHLSWTFVVCKELHVGQDGGNEEESGEMWVVQVSRGQVMQSLVRILKFYSKYSKKP